MDILLLEVYDNCVIDARPQSVACLKLEDVAVAERGSRPRWTSVAAVSYHLCVIVGSGSSGLMHSSNDIDLLNCKLLGPGVQRGRSEAADAHFLFERRSQKPTQAKSDAGFILVFFTLRYRIR